VHTTKNFYRTLLWRECHTSAPLTTPSKFVRVHSHTQINVYEPNGESTFHPSGYQLIEKSFYKEIRRSPISFIGSTFLSRYIVILGIPSVMVNGY